MGNWKLKDEYQFMARDSTLMPQLPKAVDPKEIVERVKNGSLSISAPLGLSLLCSKIFPLFLLEILKISPHYSFTFIL